MSLPNLQLIYQDAVATLSFDPEVPCSHIVWHGFASSADFRATCLRSLELMQNKQFTKGLSDARGLRVISLADQQWFTEEYVPMVMALKLGTLYSAVVMPHDFFGKQSLDNIRDNVDEMLSHRANEEVVTQYFDSEESARSWLISVGQQAEKTQQQAPSTTANE